jgi:hypothetical protein
MMRHEDAHQGPTQMAVTHKTGRGRKSAGRSGGAVEDKTESLRALALLSGAAAALRQLDRPLRTAEAADYLTAGRGVPTSPGHLANLRVTGGGPTFRRAGRYVTYTVTALDAYAAARLGPEQSSTSARAA